MAALITLGAPIGANAFVRSTTDSGTPVYWAGTCAYLVPDDATPAALTTDVFRATVQRSIANWHNATAACTYLQIPLDAPRAVEAHLDHVNVLKVRTDKWCRPAEKGATEMCYSHQAAAITTVFYNTTPGKPEDGSIVDADIELNAIDFTFVTLPSNTPPRPGTSRSDLENTLTHELGHFQGLDHTCWDHVTSTDPLDDRGVPIPDCSDVMSHHVPPDVYERVTTSTMYNLAAPEETIKRTPKADDIAGICGIYPLARDPRHCARATDPMGGCSVVATAGERGARTAPCAALGGLAAIAVAWLRARARRRPRRRAR